MVQYIARDGGYDVYYNRRLIFWAFGDKKNAEKEFEIYLHNTK